MLTIRSNPRTCPPGVASLNSNGICSFTTCVNEPDVCTAPLHQAWLLLVAFFLNHLEDRACVHDVSPGPVARLMLSSSCRDHLSGVNSTLGVLFFTLAPRRSCLLGQDRKSYQHCLHASILESSILCCTGVQGVFGGRGSGVGCRRGHAHATNTQPSLSIAGMQCAHNTL